MNLTSDPNCDLKLFKMVFDKISFIRNGFKNDEEIDLQMSVNIATNDGLDELHKVTLFVECEKSEEYSIEIQLTGFFIVTAEDLGLRNILLNQNAVALLLPYVRSQLSLLTAQPETDCIVLPPLNIKNMFESKEITPSK